MGSSMCVAVWLLWGVGLPCHTLSAADTSHSNTVLCIGCVAFIPCVWWPNPMCGFYPVPVLIAL